MVTYGDRRVRELGPQKGGQDQRKEQERPPLSPRNPRTCEGRLGLRGGLSTAAHLLRRAPAKPQQDLRAPFNQVVTREWIKKVG